MYGTGIQMQKPSSDPDEDIVYPLELCFRPVCSIPGREKWAVCVRDVGDKKNGYPQIALTHPEIEPVYEKWLNEKLQEMNLQETVWEDNGDGAPCIVRLHRIPG